VRPAVARYGPGGDVGRARGVGAFRGVGVGLGVDVGVGVGVAVAVGVGVGEPDCAQYFPPVFTDSLLSFCPPQTIISLPVHTAV
jgi:hypothetical protein